MKKTPFYLTLFWVLTIALATSHVAAQELTPQQVQDLEIVQGFRPRYINKAEQSIYNPAVNPSNSVIASPLSQVAFKAKSGGQEAAATISIPTRYVQFSAVLKQTFTEKPARITPLSLDGLDQGSAAIFSLQWKDLGPQMRDIRQALQRGDQSIFNAFNNVRTAYATRKNITDGEAIRELTYQSIRDDLTEEEKRQLYDVGLIRPRPFLAGASASFGKVHYDYVADTFARKPSELTGINRNFRAYVGWAFSYNSIFAASYTYQRKYKIATDEPVSFSYAYSVTAGTGLSKDVYLGTPTLATENRFSIEWRRLFSQPATGMATFGLIPSLHLLTTSKKVATNLTLYILQVDDENKPKGLQGGAAFGYLTAAEYNWQPFSKGVTAEVFISAPLNIFDFSQ
jgi:hypothetical protein